MTPITVGALTGLLMSVTTSYLIIGRIFHRYQARTLQIWRVETWRQHILAMLHYSIAGASLGWLCMFSGGPVDHIVFKLGTAVWITVAACILQLTLYVNWHPGFAIGLLIDWAVFIAGVLLACAKLTTRWS